MDMRELRVTQTTYFSLLTHAKPLSTMMFCDTTVGIGKKYVHMEGQTDVKSETIMYLDFNRKIKHFVSSIVPSREEKKIF